MTEAQNPHEIDTAMVLAAGYGKRMRPLSDTVPKPLIPVDGRPLIDRVLDRLVEAGVKRAIVNVHYLADQIEEHLKARSDIEISISDERREVLDTGGGVKRALPLIGEKPFLIVASDTAWIPGAKAAIPEMMARFDPDVMDMLLLVAAGTASVGLSGVGDFDLDPLGRLSRRQPQKLAPFSYASVMITTPSFYADTPDGPFSNNLLFDRAIGNERLFGVRLDGIWMHIGTPEALKEAEDALADSIL
ncbi:MAG: nucleotidyltransferase family protein [Pseudomonadota bacterium]